MHEVELRELFSLHKIPTMVLTFDTAKESTQLRKEYSEVEGVKFLRDVSNETEDAGCFHLGSTWTLCLYGGAEVKLLASGFQEDGRGGQSCLENTG